MSNNNSSAPSTDNILAGVFLMLGFCITAPLLDVAAKLASGTIAVGQITAARFIAVRTYGAGCLAHGVIFRGGTQTMVVNVVARDLFININVLLHCGHPRHAIGRCGGNRICCTLYRATGGEILP